MFSTMNSFIYEKVEETNKNSRVIAQTQYFSINRFIFYKAEQKCIFFADNDDLHLLIKCVSTMCTEKDYFITCLNT